MLPFIPGKNKIQFIKDWLRQNTSINPNTLMVNTALKVMLVEQINNNKTDSKEELGASQEDEYQVESIYMGLIKAAS